MKNILILGAAGFIFSNFFNYLKERDYEVRGLDTYTYAANEDMRPYIPCVDVTSYDQLNSWFSFEKLVGNIPDIVIIAQASTHNDRAIFDPYSFVQNNVVGTVNALETCRRFKVKKVYVISTDEVLTHRLPFNTEGFKEENISWLDIYGVWGKRDNWRFFRVREEDFLSTKFNPSSSYSASKLCQEAFVEGFRKTHKMDITVIRPTNVYGPRQYPEKLIPVVINQALKDEPIPVYGKGEQWRDYTYIDDFCRAFELILNQENPLPLYHIAANQERQNISTVKEILKQLNKPESLITYVEDRPGHDFSYSLDCTNLKKLGWKPEVSFEEGISRTIKYYENIIS